jgi:hypothetical protein
MFKADFALGLVSQRPSWPSHSASCVCAWLQLVQPGWCAHATEWASRPPDAMHTQRPPPAPSLPLGWGPSPPTRGHQRAGLNPNPNPNPPTRGHQPVVGRRGSRSWLFVKEELISAGCSPSSKHASLRSQIRMSREDLHKAPALTPGQTDHLQSRGLLRPPAPGRGSRRRRSR